MSELENIIGSIMSSPESLGAVMDVVKMFGGEEPKDKKQEKEDSKDSLSVSGLLSGAGNLDPKLLGTVMSLLHEYNADDRRIRLLGAIRPYIKESDGYHIDRAIQIVKLSHVARGLLGKFLK